MSAPRKRYRKTPAPKLGAYYPSSDEDECEDEQPARRKTPSPARRQYRHLPPQRSPNVDPGMISSPEDACGQQAYAAPGAVACAPKYEQLCLSNPAEPHRKKQPLVQQFWDTHLSNPEYGRTPRPRVWLGRTLSPGSGSASDWSSIMGHTSPQMQFPVTESRWQYWTPRDQIGRGGPRARPSPSPQYSWPFGSSSGSGSSRSSCGTDYSPWSSDKSRVPGLPAWVNQGMHQYDFKTYPPPPENPEYPNNPEFPSRIPRIPRVCDEEGAPMRDAPITGAMLRRCIRANTV